MWIWMHVSKCCRHIRLHIFMFVASFFFVLTKSKLSLFTPTFMTTCSFYCLARPPWLASRQQSSVGLPWPWLGATCRRLGITAPSVDDYRGSNLQWSTVFFFGGFNMFWHCFDHQNHQTSNGIIKWGSVINKYHHWLLWFSFSFNQHFGT